ncbi:indole-3-glycerol-phosphate synthase [Aureococcus anophagefferens]|uniref:Indole-3-glycerol-phosphate synthase n=1 Tax=Aureococcus anophagefferens TaxID=44056 RepID=A0ABR1FXW7_AURAN
MDRFQPGARADALQILQAYSNRFASLGTLPSLPEARFLGFGFNELSALPRTWAAAARTWRPWTWPSTTSCPSTTSSRACASAGSSSRSSSRGTPAACSRTTASASSTQLPALETIDDAEVTAAEREEYVLPEGGFKEDLDGFVTIEVSLKSLAGLPAPEGADSAPNSRPGTGKKDEKRKSIKKDKKKDDEGEPAAAPRPDPAKEGCYADLLVVGAPPETKARTARLFWRPSPVNAARKVEDGVLPPPPVFGADIPGNSDREQIKLVEAAKLDFNGDFLAPMRRVAWAVLAAAGAAAPRAVDVARYERQAARFMADAGGGRRLGGVSPSDGPADAIDPNWELVKKSLEGLMIKEVWLTLSTIAYYSRLSLSYQLDRFCGSDGQASAYKALIAEGMLPAAAGARMSQCNEIGRGLIWAQIESIGTDYYYACLGPLDWHMVVFVQDVACAGFTRGPGSRPANGASTEEQQQRVRVMRLTTKLRLKWKSLFVTMQILGTTAVNAFSWPPIFGTLVTVANILNKPSFLGALTCVVDLTPGRVSFYTEYVATTLGPIVAVVAFDLGLRFLAPPAHRRRYSSTAFAVVVVYCIFPGVCALVVRYWSCRTFDDGVYYLADDLAIRCGGRAYRAYEAYAILMVFVWPVGAPALLYALCWTHRGRIDPFGFRKGVDLERAALHLLVSPREILDRADAIRENDPVIGPTRMIWIPYEPEFWYFESVETIRRMGYTVASAVIPEGGMLLVFLVLLTCASLKVYGGYRPFDDETDNLLAENLSWLLLAIYLIALACALRDDASNAAVDAILNSLVALAFCYGIAVVAADLTREKKIVAIVVGPRARARCPTSSSGSGGRRAPRRGGAAAARRARAGFAGSVELGSTAHVHRVAALKATSGSSSGPARGGAPAAPALAEEEGDITRF